MSPSKPAQTDLTDGPDALLKSESSRNARWNQLREAVKDANVPTLLMVLFQATGESKWLDYPYRPTRAKGLVDHDDGGLPPSIQMEVREAAVEALAAYMEGKPLAIPAPSEELILRMMSVYLGESIPESYGRMIKEELARFSGQPVDEFNDPAPPTDFEVVVIGLGVAGTVAAKHLSEMGVRFTIFEKHHQNGGATWLMNRYPGAGVDTPSHLYSYSFAKNDWAEHFTLRDQLLPYFDRVVNELEVGEHVRYGTEVVRAKWIEADQQWELLIRSSDGAEETLRSRVIISAVGVLNRPRIPDLPGIGTFKGAQFHTSNWPGDLDLTNMRVAIVGTGASAMQIVPAIADCVGHLTILQRSPQWVAPFEKFRQGMSAGARYLLAEIPLYHAWYWLRLFWQFGDKVIDALRRDPEWPHPERAMNARNDEHRKFFTRYMKEQLGDRDDLLAAALPDYPPFGKRILLDNGWFRALTKPNVELIPEAVASVHADGLVTDRDRDVQADVIVWSTGYEATRFLASFDVIGKGGQTIREAWNDDDPDTYFGISTPGFPNLFMLGGPNSFPGSGSFMFFMEVQMRYIRRMMDAMIEKSISSIEPRADVTRDYMHAVDELHARTVWTHPGMRTWFRNSKGRVCFVMPFLNVEYWNMVRDLDLAAYHVRYSRAEPVHV